MTLLTDEETISAFRTVSKSIGSIGRGRGRGRKRDQYRTASWKIERL